MSPESCPQRLSPAIRCSEKFAQFFLFLRGVGTLRRMNLNLCLQHHTLNGFRLWRVGHLKFEMEQRCDAVNRCLNTDDLEIEIRHGVSAVHSASAPHINFGAQRYVPLRRVKNFSISRQTSSPPEKPRQ